MMYHSRQLRSLSLLVALSFFTLPATAKDGVASTFGAFGIFHDNAWGSVRLWLSADGDSYIQKYLLGAAKNHETLYVRYRFRLSSDEVAHLSAFLRDKSLWRTDCREKQIVYDATTTTIWQKYAGGLRAVCQPPEPLKPNTIFRALVAFADKLRGTGPDIEVYRGTIDDWSPVGFPTNNEIRKTSLRD